MWIHSFKKHTILIDNHLSQFLISLFLSINISHGHLFNNVGFSVWFMKPNLLQRCKAWNQSPGNGKFCEKWVWWQAWQSHSIIWKLSHVFTNKWPLDGCLKIACWIKLLTWCGGGRGARLAAGCAALQLAGIKAEMCASKGMANSSSQRDVQMDKASVRKSNSREIFLYWDSGIKSGQEHKGNICFRRWGFPGAGCLHRVLCSTHTSVTCWRHVEEVSNSESCWLKLCLIYHRALH